MFCRVSTRIALLLSFAFCCHAAHAESVARRWNDALLDAIRIDFPAPTVHSRNLYHSSAAMYDAWSAYDAVAGGHFYTDKHSIDGIDAEAARNEAVSYAAYRVLSERYQQSTFPIISQAIFDSVMDDLGYDPNFTSTVGNAPSAVGNRIAAQILTQTLDDGSNEANGYVDNTGYSPSNLPMVVEYPGLLTPDADPFEDPNRWQPLFLNEAVTQNDLEGTDLQTYIGPHWGSVKTFAMGQQSGAQPSWADIDPGPPPQFGGDGDAEYKSDSLLVIQYSNSLDPTKGPGAEVINISPAVTGNRPLGTHTDVGYSVNPVTGAPYEANMVKTADYGRILAEFWADGPKSETPPGHWNVLANEVSEHPELERRIGGQGPVVSDLEWDVKMYMTLNGASHDSAVAAWGVKREYDYVRPITKIRYQGSLGQSSDESLPSYHKDGLPLEEGAVELITAESIATGGRHRNAYLNANRNGRHFTEEEMVGKVVIHSWNHEPDDPANELSGTDWIIAENWVPYQDDNFVTPAFAAYVSGHSTFSRAAAEVLTEFTGSEYFPGGLGEQTFDVDFLDFEDGPSEPVTLQWATYRDAADEAGISRLWGGIHVPADDFAGRVMGANIGQTAYAAAEDLFVRGDLGWCNVVFETDVDNDGEVTLLDLNQLIAEVNSRMGDEKFGAADRPDGIPSLFFDVTNDGYIVARDVLAVVNRLNESSSNRFSVASIPEPASSMLVCLGLLVWVCGSRRRRHK